MNAMVAPSGDPAETQDAVASIASARRLSWPVLAGNRSLMERNEFNEAIVEEFAPTAALRRRFRG
jgi:hypothetical protein